MMQRVLLALVLGIVGTLLIELIAVVPRSSIDFTAFYCAGSVIDDHGDPYRAIPLGTCEHRLTSGDMYGVPDVVLPAPLPPYALAVFAAVAQFPYRVAITVWRLLLLVAIAVTIIALRGVTQVRWPAIALALIPVDVIGCVLWGQVVPLVVAATAIGAWALQRRADRIAAVAVCLTMLEPHVGLPACLSLFAYRPAARVPLLIGAAIAVILSVSSCPVSLSVEYFTRVLPQHAASEVGWPWQYSLTHALHVLGASDRVALTLGSFSYIGTAVLAMVLSPRAAERLAAPGLLVALPSALAIFGGSYIHIAQLPCALPAALMFAGRATGRVASLGAGACILLTFAGIQFGLIAFVIATAAIAVTLTAMLFRTSVILRVAIVTVVLAAGAAFHGVHPISIATDVSWTPRSTESMALADESWSRFVRLVEPGPEVQRLALLAELPTWAGLGLLCGAAALSAFAGVRGKVKAEAALPDPCRG